MTIIERIQQLCQEHGTTLIGLERSLGLGRGTIRKWNTSSPSIDKLGAIADYFNTTIDYLRSGNKQNKQIINNNDIKNMRRIERARNKMSPKDREKNDENTRGFF